MTLRRSVLHPWPSQRQIAATRIEPCPRRLQFRLIVSKMKALVTGGAGFIGSHIAEALCRRGATVIALDNLSLGDAKNLDWRRTGDKLEFVQGDASDRALIQ